MKFAKELEDELVSLSLGEMGGRSGDGTVRRDTEEEADRQ
jgi:hypothetical protein